jgi:subtilase family serine protease
MKTNKNTLNFGLLAIVALALFPHIAAAQQMKTLGHHVPAAISRMNLQPSGNLSPDTTLNLTISLPLHNEQAMDTLLQQIYDPSSKNYHHYLTPAQFNTQFGPNWQDYQMAINFARVNNLNVIGTYSNQMILDVSGNVKNIEKAFNVKLRKYHHPFENRDFYAPDKDPSVNAALPIFHVSGLDNYLIPHPAFIKEGVTTGIKPGVKEGLGSGPNGEYMGIDFRTAYTPGVTLNGAGQNVALYELDGYFPADIISYEVQAGLPSVTITNVAVDGGVPNPTALVILKCPWILKWSFRCRPTLMSFWFMKLQMDLRTAW